MAVSTPEAALLRDLGLGRGEIAYHGIFTVEDQIGRGSDADVYRVVWQGIPVAAKVFHPRHDQADVEGRDKNLRRFGAEIARLSKLHHPNLCQVLGVAVTADRHLPVLVVELFDHTLCECSVGADRFDHVALLSFLADAVAGVRYLHSRDPPVIHRDLTLRNVLIKGQIAKLCDFGCARLRPTSPADLVGFLPDLTACPGNVLYMAPEALQNPPVYDESLDIFSFGVLATSVVTGVEPSTDLHTSPRTIIRQVERADGTREETVTAITEVERRGVDLERIPDGHPLKPAIFRCLAVVAEDRPKAEELHDIVLDTVKVARGFSPLQVRPTTAPEGLSSSASATASATTAMVPVSSPIAAQDRQSSSASATAPAVTGSPTVTRVTPSTAPESLSSSASATASAATATVPVSSPIAAQDSRASSASASAPATASATATRAEATAAASTAVSSVGRGYHVLPAMPTPTQIANIKKRRKWNKVVGGPGKSFFKFWNTSRPEVPPHGKHAMLATYSDKLVAMWYDGAYVTKITETSDLQTWRSIDLPSEYSKLAGPSLASHGGMLYMYCLTLSKSTNTWVRSILQYCDTPDNGDGGRSGGGGGGGGGQWTKLMDVSHCRHDWCTLHACHDAISLYGGSHDLSNHKHVSTYSLASKQWSSSASSNASLVLPSLPQPCSKASLVSFPDSLYLVGGNTGCFFKHHDGRWVSTSPPDRGDLKLSAACALSDHSMVICPNAPFTECVVHDISSGQVHPLPAVPKYSYCTPSLTLFGSTLVLSVCGPHSSGSLYTLDMSV
ncbi:probable serine/threonine-protein kinase roco4 isoform X2 [Sycon ciliatum]|uniref:probable serine/threonine-protein kinase roco4 isoform X2 n=1 Tax=Sycon ciliatum TaxID=27933 RepID=UPI0031F710B0